MNQKQPNLIRHLPGIRSYFAQADRLNIHYLDTDRKGLPVLFLHGNASSSTFWEEAMLKLPSGFRGIAPDLRGYGLTDPTALVDAQRGTGEWIDDIYTLLEAMKIERFHLVGHSMGGMISWGILSDSRYASRVLSTTLVAPGPPCGFGGMRGLDGLPNNPEFSGSGAGLVHPRFAELIGEAERELKDPIFSPRAVMNRLFWKPPFRPKREEDLLNAVLQIHTGNNQFPGDVSRSEYWPHFAPGQYGPANAISGRYNQSTLNNLIQAPHKPPLMVVVGEDDPIISDFSQGDAATLGKMGVLPGWPGEETFPQQPFLSQVKFAVDRYNESGGRTQWITFKNCGHTPYIEQADKFRKVFHTFLNESKKA